MSGSADFVAAVLALPNLDCLLEMQDASGNPVDSSPNGFDITSVTGTVTYQVAGPDAGLDFGISLNPGVLERNAPMNTNTVDWAVGLWVRWIGNSVNQALVENGNPGADGYGALLVALAAIRGIAHGIGFKGTTTSDLDDGLWQFVGFQSTAGGSWEVYFGGVADASSPIGSGGINTPTTKFVIARDGAQFEVAYVFSVSEALAPSTWLALNVAMVGGPPVNTVPPVLSGAAVVGEILTTSDGTWTDADSFAYQWETSPDGLASWTPLGGETASTYEVVTGDIGNFLRCVVTATNGDGDTDEPSNVLGPVLAALSGAVVVGFSSGDHVDTFAASDWTPDTSGVLAGDYMIAYIEAAFSGPGAGITAPAGWEVLENDTVLGTGRASVYGKFTYEDAPTEVFAFASAATFVGVLTAARGGFNASDPVSGYAKTTDNTLGNVAYSTQDLVLGVTLGNDTIVANIAAIPVGFTDEILEKTAVVSVTGFLVDATKLEAVGAGSTSGLSFTYANGSDFYTLTILLEFNPGDVPVNVTPPVATGDVIVDGTVTTTNGTWTFSPLSYTYQWQESVDGSTGWANIGGATSSTYLIDISHSGMFLRCRVTAHNADGASVPEPSNVLGPVAPYPTVRQITAIA